VENSELILRGRNLRKNFINESGAAVHALDDVSFEIPYGTLSALVGPDGAGKTTLIRLIAGLLPADAGELSVLGIDVARDPQRVQERIGYMPQKFGLYEDLTVQENLNLYADLHGVSSQERQARYPLLMSMTNLGPFTDRFAGRLSGGMKQKLGLACTLVRAPDLLVLDEPTVGVDPLSRRELWEIIFQLVRDHNLSVLLSTSYLDEAERCQQTIVLHQGRILRADKPQAISALAAGRTFLADTPPNQKTSSFQARLLARTDVLDAVPEGGRVRVVLRRRESDKRETLSSVPPRFEDGFMVLLAERDREIGRLLGEENADLETRRHGDKETPDLPLSQSPSLHVSPIPQLAQSPGLPVSESSSVVVEVRDLVRRFGQFVAVDHVSFDVRRGEIFGLLGPNGAGKTTTFRMLCGLLPASGGTLRVAGADLRRARAAARQRIGYVAQKFSLYGELSAIENLDFFASAYGLRRERKKSRIAWALEEFELSAHAQAASALLPGGFKQRLAMAAALLHEPEIIFLDEPTSGVDPLARREFWRRITSLSEAGVTAIVTTHFMEEAEYCDRIVILDAGRVLAQGTPAEIRRRGERELGHQATMEDAFIAIVEEAREEEATRRPAAGANA
jgi:ABC-2 type transport system ATP-binding protein